MPGLDAVRDLHPLAVHFPIALWAAALLFWVLARSRREDLWRTGRWLLYLAVLAALGAVGSGLWAADRIGHDAPGHDRVHVHRNFMLATTLLGATTAALAWWWRERSRGWRRAVLLSGLALTVVLCALGADRGALLVYRHGIGTRMEGCEPALPEGAEADAGATEGPATASPEPHHHDHEAGAH